MLETLYLIDTDAVRPALLAFVRSAPLSGLHFQRLRFLFKRPSCAQTVSCLACWPIASPKKASDAELWLARAHRFTWRRRATTCSCGCGDGCGPRGALADRDYIKMAVGVLLPFVDADAVAVRSVGRNHWGPFAPYWAFNHILYGKEPAL